jgi:negative regulator of flagellin synthesis FlgM
MKINDSQRISAVHSLYGKTKGVETTGSGSPKKKDQVSISGEAMELLQTQNSSDSDRVNKINDLKKSVEAGTYRVEAGKLAEKLLPFIR